MPPLTKPAQILKYVTPDELEARYVGYYLALGYSLTLAIEQARARVRRLQDAARS